MEQVKRGFKRKTIVDCIETKIDNWVKTLPPEMRAEVHNDVIVTGGAIASMLQGDLPNDYDLYFKTPAVAQRLANYYLSELEDRQSIRSLVQKIEAIAGTDRVTIMIKSAGVLEENTNIDDYQYFENLDPKEVEKYFQKWTMSKPKKEGEKETFRPAYITSNAITLHDGIQLIMRFCGDPETIHKNFDYVHCTNYWTKHTGLVLKQEALEAILARELKYVGSLYPVCSIFRMRKFIKRGWSITAGEMFKMTYDCSKLNLNDYNVLRDQLIGVDAAYFSEILHIIRDKKDGLDRTYLFEIINRVFDEADGL